MGNLEVIPGRLATAEHHVCCPLAWGGPVRHPQPLSTVLYQSGQAADPMDRGQVSVPEPASRGPGIRPGSAPRWGRGGWGSFSAPLPCRGRPACTHSSLATLLPSGPSPGSLCRPLEGLTIRPVPPARLCGPSLSGAPSAALYLPPPRPLPSTTPGLRAGATPSPCPF